MTWRWWSAPAGGSRSRSSRRRSTTRSSLGTRWGSARGPSSRRGASAPARRGASRAAAGGRGRPRPIVVLAAPALAAVACGLAALAWVATAMLRVYRTGRRSARPVVRHGRLVPRRHAARPRGDRGLRRDRDGRRPVPRPSRAPRPGGAPLACGHRARPRRHRRRRGRHRRGRRHAGLAGRRRDPAGGRAARPARAQHARVGARDRGMGYRRVVAVSTPFHAARIEAEGRRRGIAIATASPPATAVAAGPDAARRSSRSPRGSCGTSCLPRSRRGCTQGPARSGTWCRSCSPGRCGRSTRSGHGCGRAARDAPARADAEPPRPRRPRGPHRPRPPDAARPAGPPLLADPCSPTRRGSGLRATLSGTRGPRRRLLARGVGDLERELAVETPLRRRHGRLGRRVDPPGVPVSQARP